MQLAVNNYWGDVKANIWHCFCDFETGGILNVKNHGTSRYAKDRNTVAYMLAYGITSYEPRVLVRDKDLFQQFIDNLGLWMLDLESMTDTAGCPEDLKEAILNDSVLFHAHNAKFERYIYREIMVERHKWPEIDDRRWRCTQAKASYANMPKSLDKLSERLRLDSSYQKDKRGSELIQLLSKPQKALVRDIKAGKIDINDLFEVPGKKGRFYWRKDEDLFEEFRAYCKQDVVAEVACDARLPQIPDSELEVFFLDLDINSRGLPIDRELCEGAIKIREAAIEEINEEISELVGEEWLKEHNKGKILRVTQDKKINQWINEQGANFGESMRESVVLNWLDSDEAEQFPQVTDLLQMRLKARSNTATKYATALEYSDADDRVRESLLYHGAAPGRWTGSGFHPHNFKRVAIPDEFYFDLLKTGDLEAVKLWADDAIGLLKNCVRGIIRAQEGKTFVISDFAGIEARVTHWMCRNEKMLELFRANQDVYIEAACDIYGKTHEEIATWNEEKRKWIIKKEFSYMRDMGKRTGLGLQYRMGWETFQGHAKNDGVFLDDEFCKIVVQSWRDANPIVCDCWDRITNACLHVIRTGKTATWENVRITMHGGSMCCVLPSGRVMWYYKPRIGENKWGGQQIEYLDGSKKDEKSAYVGTHGGKLLENWVQGTSRDLLTNSMKLIELEYPCIFSVHDESVTEVDDQDADDAYVWCHSAMETKPGWATDLPLAAETFITRRYTKE